MTKLILSLILAAGVMLGQTTINGGRTILGAWDASGATTTKPIKTGTVAAMPATCAAGELYWATDGPVARKLFTCEATNTWVQSAYTQGTTAPTACTLGDMFFDTDATAGSNLLLCTATGNPGTWTAISGGGGGSTYYAGDLLSLNGTTFNANPIDPRYAVLTDEFCGAAGTTNSQTAGQLRWRQGVSGSGSSAFSQGTWQSPCLMTLTTGATSGNGVWFSQNGSTTMFGPLVSNSDKPWEMVWVFKFPAATDYANVEMRIGLGDALSSSIPGTHSPHLRFDTVAGDTTFKFVSRVSNTDNVYDTGVAPDTALHTLRIYSDGTTANKVYFMLDGGTARTACASGCDINAIASAATPQAFAGIYAREAAAKNLALDFFGFKAQVSTNANRRN